MRPKFGSLGTAPPREYPGGLANMEAVDLHKVEADLAEVAAKRVASLLRVIFSFLAAQRATS